MLQLKTTERKAGSDTTTLRAEGMVPAVIYGAKEESAPCAVAQNAFIKVWREAGETALVELETASGKKNVMIHQVQRDPVSDAPIHIDFYAVTKGQKIEVAVPLEFVGTSPAVKEQGAVLVKVMHELTLSGEPANIPQQIEVSIETLADMNSQIVAKDIALPSGLELITNPDEMIVAVSEAKEEEEEEPTEVDMDSIEVESKGKKEEETEEENS